MPRLLTDEELSARGARTRDGAAFSPRKKPEPEPEKPAPMSVVVEAATIDTGPIAEVMRELVAAMQQAKPEPTISPAKPEEWEFTIERDVHGKIERIRAVAKG